MLLDHFRDLGLKLGDHNVPARQYNQEQYDCPFEIAGRRNPQLWLRRFCSCSMQ